MTCLFPMNGWRSKKLSENGKRPIVFRRSEGYEEMAIQVPCGKCIGCLADKASSWAIRCYHESYFYDQNSFLTLTYDDRHYPGKLVKEDFQKFIREVRDYCGSLKVKFYGCGEYGEQTGRAHYHILIFGTDFRNGQEIQYTKNSFLNPVVTELWGRGHVTISDFTMATACYTAGYVAKKLKHPDRDEFQAMSQGLGFSWIREHWRDVLKSNQITIDGQQYPVPPAYIRYMEERQNNELDQVKRFRKAFAEAKYEKQGLDQYRERRAKQCYMEQTQAKKERNEKL